MEGFKITEIGGVVILFIAALLWVFVSFTLAAEFGLIAGGIILIGDGIHHDSIEPKLYGTLLVLAGLFLLFFTRIQVH